MKKSKRHVCFSAVCSLTMCVSVFATMTLAACNTAPEHKHTYDLTTYEYDDEYHWNPATCGHTNEKGNKAAHDGADGCTVCDWTRAPAKAKFINLTELDPTETVAGHCDPTIDVACLGDKFLCNGFPVETGISMHPSADKDTWLTYDISGYDYDTFVVTVGKNDQQKDCKVVFSVWVDGVKKWDSGEVKEADMRYVELDVAGADTLKLVVNNGGDSHSFDEATWAYPALIDSADLAPVSITCENVEPFVIKGENPLDGATAVIRYNTGTIERVASDALEFVGFNADEEGEQTVKVTYKNFTSSFNVKVCEQGTVANLWALEFVEFVSYFPKRVPGVDTDDETPFAVAGINYKNGIGLHPVSDDSPAYLKIILDPGSKYAFHAVFGKTRKAIRNEVVFSVSGDGVELWKSGFMLPGQSVTADFEFTGVTELVIAVDSGDDGISADCAGLADAFLAVLS